MARSHYGTLIKRVCNELLVKEWGYRYEGGLYVRRRGEMLLGIDIQRNSWSPSYIVNATLDYLTRPFSPQHTATSCNSLINAGVSLLTFRRSNVHIQGSPENTEVWCDFDLSDPDDEVLARFRRYLVICHEKLEELSRSRPKYQDSITKVTSYLVRNGALKRGRQWKILQSSREQWLEQIRRAWLDVFEIGYCPSGRLESFLANHHILQHMAQVDQQRFFAAEIEAEIQLCILCEQRPDRSPLVAYLKRCIAEGADLFLDQPTLETVLKQNGFDIT